MYLDLERDYRVKVQAQSETGTLIVTPQDLGKQLNLTPDEITDEASYLQSLILTAQREAEQYTGRSLNQVKFTNFFNVFTNRLKLFPVPVQTLEAVKYKTDSDTTESADLSRFVFDNTISPAELRLAQNKTFPDGLAEEVNAVQIEVTAGHKSDSVPAPIKQAVIIKAATLYENRTAGVNERLDTFATLLRPYRIRVY